LRGTVGPWTNPASPTGDSSLHLAQQAKDTGFAVLSSTAGMFQDLAGKAIESVSSAAETGKALAGQALETVTHGFSTASETGKDLASSAFFSAADSVDSTLKEAGRILEETELTAGAAEFFARSEREQVFDNDFGQLTTWENEEREFRMNPEPIMQRFALALRTSDLIKDWQGYQWEDAPNRHYATAVMEAYERKRRFLQDEADQTSMDNAKQLAGLLAKAHFRKAQKTATATATSAASAEAWKAKSLLKAEQSPAPLAQTGLAAM